jgi:hypothetical protein
MDGNNDGTPCEQLGAPCKLDRVVDARIEQQIQNVLKGASRVRSDLPCGPSTKTR